MNLFSTITEASVFRIIIAWFYNFSRIVTKNSPTKYEIRLLIFQSKYSKLFISVSYNTYNYYWEQFQLENERSRNRIWFKIWVLRRKHFSSPFLILWKSTFRYSNKWTEVFEISEIFGCYVCIFLGHHASFDIFAYIYILCLFGWRTESFCGKSLFWILIFSKFYWNFRPGQRYTKCLLRNFYYYFALIQTLFYIVVDIYEFSFTQYVNSSFKRISLGIKWHSRSLGIS